MQTFCFCEDCCSSFEISQLWDDGSSSSSSKGENERSLHEINILVQKLLSWNEVIEISQENLQPSLFLFLLSSSESRSLHRNYQNVSQQTQKETLLPRINDVFFGRTWHQAVDDWLKWRCSFILADWTFQTNCCFVATIYSLTSSSIKKGKRNKHKCPRSRDRTLFDTNTSNYDIVKVNISGISTLQ